MGPVSALCVDDMKLHSFVAFTVGPPYMLYFRVKFYVSDPSRLNEEYTRHDSTVLLYLGCVVCVCYVLSLPSQVPLLPSSEEGHCFGEIGCSIPDGGAAGQLCRAV